MKRSFLMIVAGAAFLMMLNPLSPAPVAAQEPIPNAVYQDPPANSKYPAMSGGVRFNIHGAWVNAEVFVPAGDGLHPTALLLHGLPGNEENLDLARALQRDGWTVVAFHYRGSWLSDGTFSLEGGVEDANAMLEKLRDPRAKVFRADPSRVVLIGHSYGGYVAMRVAAAHPEVRGVVLIAPWDINYDARAWAGLSKPHQEAMAEEVFNDVDGRLTGADALSLMAETLREGPAFHFAAEAKKLSNRPVLLLTATNDSPDTQAIGFDAAFRDAHTNFQHARMTTDHSFDDHRIALETAILRWLSERFTPFKN